MMTPKERLLCALNREKPDRLPFTVHQWQRYHLDTYLDGIGDLEAMVHFGMDAAVQHVQPAGQFWLDETDFSVYSTSEWRETVTVLKSDPDDRAYLHTIETPDGTLTYRTAGNRATIWLTEHMIKRPDELDLVRKYMPRFELEKAPVAELYDQIGDRGILRGMGWGDQAGCWQHACCLVGTTELILQTFDDPAWVHELLGTLLERKLHFVESMAGAKFDLVETGGGASSSTVVSPKIHREYCLPYDRKLHDALHAQGFKVAYHTCGGTKGIEEMIVENGTDASETLASPTIGGNCEPWELKAKIGNRVALIGGLDQINLLTRGTPEQIHAQVKVLFEKVGNDGGYILSCADHFFDAPVENLQAYADAALECRY